MRLSMIRWFLGTLILVGLFFAWALVRSGERPVTPLENIHGIPFPARGAGQQVTEKLAHADIYLHEPVLAKKLELTIEAELQRVQELRVGIRENSFWLSYTPITIYRQDRDKEPIIRKTVTIPLTDKLQEKDQSIDLMFFADSDTTDLGSIDEGVNDRVAWQLNVLAARVIPAWPTWAQVKDYGQSILKRERAL